MRTWALIPVKSLTAAKTRLRPTLSTEECAALAQCMGRDVVTALRGARCVQKVNLLGSEANATELGGEYDCEVIAEDEDSDLNSNLAQAARRLAQDGARTLLILPGDLPMLTTTDIESLLKQHTEGVTVCPAIRDGGTNALVVTPPDAIHFYFGEDSARRHIEAAQQAELAHRSMELAAFARDIDTPDDLLWFCQQAGTGLTADYVRKSGIARRIQTTAKSALA